jgi:hypothetical protein
MHGGIGRGEDYFEREFATRPARLQQGLVHSLRKKRAAGKVEVEVASEPRRPGWQKTAGANDLTVCIQDFVRRIRIVPEKDQPCMTRGPFGVTAKTLGRGCGLRPCSGRFGARDNPGGGGRR